MTNTERLIILIIRFGTDFYYDDNIEGAPNQAWQYGFQNINGANKTMNDQGKGKHDTKTGEKADYVAESIVAKVY